jgi:hypothetical protein
MKALVLAILFTLLNSSAHSQSAWQQQSPLPTLESLQSSFFFDAALDGLSDDERDFAVELGASLGLPPTLVHLLIAEAKAMALAMRAGNQEMVTALMRMREAIYDFAFEAPVVGALDQS